MALAIHNLMESVCNPAGRFKMLEGICVETDEMGDPVFSFSGVAACFSVRWDSKRYMLKCFLHSQYSSKFLLRQIAEYLEQVKSPYLVDYVYLNDEMLVYNDFGEPHYTDVVLMEYPEDATMDEYVSAACDRNDTVALTKLLDEFCRMAVWLINDGIVHGAIRANNVLVSNDCRLHLINYESMQVPPMGSLDKTVIDSDNIVVANLALGLKVIASNPSAFRLVRGNSMFRMPVLRSSLLPMFADAAERSNCLSLQLLVEMLSTCNHTLHSRRELSEVLEALAADRTPIRIDLARILPDQQDELDDLPDEVRDSDYTRVRDLSSVYSWVGPVCESMICVERDDLWGYLNSDGQEVLPLQYQWASDFVEGRAAVIVGDGENYALIDKAGREVLPAIYELVDWDGVHGVAKVAYEGFFGLFDRNGREIVPFIYDWMGDTGNDLILVRARNKKSGYIRHNGEVAIPIDFDDAYDFDGEEAIVTKDGRTYTIDKNGCEIASSDKEALGA